MEQVLTISDSGIKIGVHVMAWYKGCAYIGSHCISINLSSLGLDMCDIWALAIEKLSKS